MFDTVRNHRAVKGRGSASEHGGEQFCGGRAQIYAGSPIRHAIHCFELSGVEYATLLTALSLVQYAALLTDLSLVQYATLLTAHV